MNGSNDQIASNNQGDYLQNEEKVDKPNDEAIFNDDLPTNGSVKEPDDHSIPVVSDLDDDTNSQLGNAIGNIMNSGKVIEIEGELYYYDHIQSALVKDDTVVLNDRDIMALNYLDDWIYYSTFKKIKKARLDGSEVIDLLDKRARFIQVVGDWIYYYPNYPHTEKGIYRLSTDGTFNSLEIEIKGTINSFSIYDNWIYYNDRGIFKQELDSKKTVKISDHTAAYMYIESDMLYYMNRSDNDKIYSVDFNGNNDKVIYDKRVVQNYDTRIRTFAYK